MDIVARGGGICVTQTHLISPPLVKPKRDYRFALHPSVRPSLPLSVRPSHSFSAFFSYILWHIELKFCIWLCFIVLHIKFECCQFASIFSGSYAPFETQNTENTQLSALFSYMLRHIELKLCIWLCFLQLLWELCPFWNLEYGNTQFSALFSYMLWHIELKFCIWLCFTILQIKFEWCQFASIFSPPPLICFDILNWNFAYDFDLLYYRSSLSIVNLRQYLVPYRWNRRGL